MNKSVRQITFEDFRVFKFPSTGSDDQYPTLKSLEVLRKQYGPELNILYLKWGMEAIRDAAAFGHIESYARRTKDPKELYGRVRQVLLGTDWDVIELIMDESRDDFQRWVERSGHSSIISLAKDDAFYHLGNRARAYVDIKVLDPGGVFDHFAGKQTLD